MPEAAASKPLMPRALEHAADKRVTAGLPSHPFIEVPTTSVIRHEPRAVPALCPCLGESATLPACLCCDFAMLLCPRQGKHAGDRQACSFPVMTSHAGIHHFQSSSVCPISLSPSLLVKPLCLQRLSMESSQPRRSQGASLETAMEMLSMQVPMPHGQQ